jgi:hypothetical protein
MPVDTVGESRTREQRTLIGTSAFSLCPSRSGFAKCSAPLYLVHVKCGTRGQVGTEWSYRVEQIVAKLREAEQPRSAGADFDYPATLGDPGASKGQGVYAGSTPLPFEDFGRHLGPSESLEPSDLR